MSKPKLVYFDAPVSRGEECRLAFHVAGIAFEDVRLKREEWAARKPASPFGGLPILEIEGKPPLAQSNAILAYVGRMGGLLPKDDFEAARHEAMMMFVEDLRGLVSPSMRMSDADDKRKAREALMAGPIPDWAARAERFIGDGPGPFFGGAALSVADIKIFVVVRWLESGSVDHIPATVFAAQPKLRRIHDAVRDDRRIQSWNAAR